MMNRLTETHEEFHDRISGVLSLLRSIMGCNLTNAEKVEYALLIADSALEEMHGRPNIRHKERSNAPRTPAAAA